MNQFVVRSVVLCKSVHHMRRTPYGKISSIVVRLLIGALVWLLFSFPNASFADQSLGPDYQYLCNYTVGSTPVGSATVCFPGAPNSPPWVDTVEAVGAQECQYVFNNSVGIWTSIVGCAYKSSSIAPGNGLPNVVLSVSYYSCGSASGPNCQGVTYSEDVSFFAYIRYNPAGYSLKVDPKNNSQPLACCENKIDDPIDPVNGSTIDVVDDLANGLALHRFYSSRDTASNNLGVAWHRSYERRVVLKYSSLTTQLYVASANTSSNYSDPTSACTNGFVQIQSKVPAWSGATALYVDGNCQLTKAGVSVGSVPIYYTRQTLPLASTPVVYDLIRDDGQVVRFTVQGGVIITPPTTTLRLVLTGSGYTVTDGNDNVEQYDTSGRLLSVSSRAGVVQTMSYDSSGRLAAVIDNFGHQLTLAYDTQNRLISVTRQ